MPTKHRRFNVTCVFIPSEDGVSNRMFENIREDFSDRPAASGIGQPADSPVFS